jgi:hypothetical protein
MSSSRQQLNSQVSQPNPAGHGGRIVNLPLAPGASTNVTSAGTRAYLVVATAAVNMRPGGVRTGDFTLYSQGTGIQTVNPFDWIEINNPNSVPVVISLWLGFDDFIDNRLILANATLQNITYPTQSTGTTAQILIPDLSGGAFFDINNKKWLALFRQAIIISNLDPATPVLLQKYGAASSSGPAVLSCPPSLPIAHNSSGNFTIVGGTASVIVSEIYQAIPSS